MFVEHVDDGPRVQHPDEAEPSPTVALIGDLGEGIRPLVIDELHERGITARPVNEAGAGGHLLGALIGVTIPAEVRRSELRKRIKHLKAELHDLAPLCGPGGRVLVVVRCADEPAANRIDESVGSALRDVHAETELEQAYELSVNAFDITGSTDIRMVTSRIVDYFVRSEVPVTGEVATIGETREQSLCAALAQRFVL